MSRSPSISEVPDAQSLLLLFFFVFVFFLFVLVIFAMALSIFGYLFGIFKLPYS